MGVAATEAARKMRELKGKPAYRIGGERRGRGEGGVREGGGEIGGEGLRGGGEGLRGGGEGLRG